METPCIETARSGCIVGALPLSYGPFSFVCMFSMKTIDFDPRELPQVSQVAGLGKSIKDYAACQPRPYWVSWTNTLGKAV